MKKLLLICLLFSSVSHASLKISGQANVYDQGANTRPQVGLAFYQPLMKHIAFNSWAGIGVEPFDNKSDVTWKEAKAQVDFINGKYTLSPGVVVKDVNGEDNKRSYGFIKLDYQIF